MPWCCRTCDYSNSVEDAAILEFPAPFCPQVSITICIDHVEVLGNILCQALQPILGDTRFLTWSYYEGFVCPATAVSRRHSHYLRSGACRQYFVVSNFFKWCPLLVSLTRDTRIPLNGSNCLHRKVRSCAISIPEAFLPLWRQPLPEIDLSCPTKLAPSICCQIAGMIYACGTANLSCSLIRCSKMLIVRDRHSLGIQVRHHGIFTFYTNIILQQIGLLNLKSNI